MKCETLKVRVVIRLEIDCNRTEAARTIVVHEGVVAKFGLKAGDRVVLYEPGMECEAILRPGETWPWGADIVEGTIKDLPIEE
jgi:hypothetical protein